MERKTIFLALFSAFVACFFVACSNDSDALDINALDVKAGTRSVGLSSYMTREEIQDRLDEIGEKYGETIVFVDDADTTKVTEEFFIWIESLYQNDNKKKAIEVGTTVIDDEQIDEIAISEIGTYAATGEVNSHTGTISIDHSFKVTLPNDEYYYDWVKVIITWYANTGGGMNKATAKLEEVVVSDGNYSLIGFSHTPFVGDVSNPGFSYSYTIMHPNKKIIRYSGMK